RIEDAAHVVGECRLAAAPWRVKMDDETGLICGRSMLAPNDPVRGAPERRGKDSLLTGVSGSILATHDPVPGAAAFGSEDRLLAGAWIHLIPDAIQPRCKDERQLRAPEKILVALRRVADEDDLASCTRSEMSGCRLGFRFLLDVG